MTMNPIIQNNSFSSHLPLQPKTPLKSQLQQMFCTTRFPLTCQILSLPSPPFHHTSKTQSRPFLNHQFTPDTSKHRLQFSLHRTLLKTQIRCAADTGSGSRNWEKWLPKNVFSADKVLRLIAGATSSPICQFISSPTTFLHTVDPRIKLVIMFF